MNQNSNQKQKVMKQEINVLLPVELTEWLISEKTREQTTLSQVVVRAIAAYRRSKDA